MRFELSKTAAPSYTIDLDAGVPRQGEVGIDQPNSNFDGAITVVRLEIAGCVGGGVD